jgi:hypothetical protein
VKLTDEMKLMEHATLTERVKNLEQQLAEATKVIEKLRAARVFVDTTCVCGHLKSTHIYEEGACRPGFVCECEGFRAALRESGDT